MSLTKRYLEQLEEQQLQRQEEELDNFITEMNHEGGTLPVEFGEWTHAEKWAYYLEIKERNSEEGGSLPF